MRNLVDYINIYEMKGNKIDDNWLNNRKPVMTKDGRNVLIEKIDYAEVPNIIYGKVAANDKVFDFKWDDTGKCIEAQDKMGNPCAPDDNDMLVKAY